MATISLAPASPPALRITLLGGFRVAVAGQAIPDTAWRLRKAAALVKLLALAPGQMLQREQLLDLLWPDLPPAAAAHNLRYTLHVARGILEGPPHHLPRALHLEGEILTLRPDGPLWIDAVAFMQAATAAQRGDDPAVYAAALACYSGELLPADRYEDWAAPYREVLRERHLALLRRLAGLHTARGDTPGTIGVLETLVSAEPTDEAAHTALMRLYAATGQRACALRQYARLRTVLQQDLGIEPEAASQRLYAAILAGQLSAQEAAPRPPDQRALSTPPHNLPAPSSSFIGRAHEIAALGRLVSAAEQRLITLLGAGGSGKTRLAIELARAQLTGGAFPDGIWFIDLSAITVAALAPTAVARALGVPEHAAHSPTDGIIARLGTATALLVLDNCEHLAGACAGLAHAILAACPRVQLLATSREALHVPGERTWQVPPLSLPPLPRAGAGASAPLQPETLLQGSEAARLFCARAAFSRADFTVTTDNAATIAALCHRLDGIPLALELAAARSALLTPDQLATRLDDALGLLTNGARTAPTRQRALRATLDWSHTLLDPAERTLFHRLAPFAGGWTIEAAEAVGSAAGIARGAVLDLLAQLVDRSLVAVDTTHAVARYRLLEIVRQYARERLEESGEAAPIAARHAAHYLALAEAAAPHLNTDQQADWLARLDTEQDNLRAALRAVTLAGDRLTALQLAGALWWFWYLRGQYREGRDMLLAALGDLDATPADPDDDRCVTAARARALLGACALTWRSGDYPLARRLGEQGLALYRALNEPHGTAWTLIFLSHVCGPLHDDVAGPAYIAEALPLFRACGDAFGLARTLNALGETARQANDHARAAALFTECLALDRAAGNTGGRALRLMNLGCVVLRQGDVTRAAALLRESLDLSLRLANTLLIANCLDGFAGVATERAQPALAVQLFGAADTLLAEVATTREADPPQHLDYVYYSARARAALDAQAADVVWAAGHALSRADAVALAEHVAQPPAAQASPGQETPPAPVAALSPREREVAALIAAGHTNARIAAALGMSKRTVDTHVGTILRKLALTSRAEVAARLAAHQPPR